MKQKKIIQIPEIIKYFNKAKIKKNNKNLNSKIITLQKIKTSIHKIKLIFIKIIKKKKVQIIVSIKIQQI